MPVSFEVEEKQRYFVSRYTGQIDEHEMMSAWRAFLNSESWKAGMHELADFSRLSAEGITTQSLVRLNQYVRDVYTRFSVSPRVAVVIPEDVKDRRSGIYAGYLENSHVSASMFRQASQARAWLLSST